MILLNRTESARRVRMCAEDIARDWSIGIKSARRIVAEITGLKRITRETEVTEWQLNNWIEARSGDEDPLASRISEMEAYALAAELTARSLRYVVSKLKKGASPPVGFVYICRHRNREHIKVGYSNHPVRRLAEHQPTRGYLNPLLVICAEPPLERSIHLLFARWRLAGETEWFHASAQVLAFINWLAEEINSGAS